MSPAILHRVIHGTPRPEAWQRALLTVRPALLPGYRRHRVRDADYPAVVPHAELAADDGVRGTVVTGLSDMDMMRLDRFEGSDYRRARVRARVVVEGAGAGDEVEVETFVWSSPREELEDGEWDFREFMREKAFAWIGVEREDYVGECWRQAVATAKRRRRAKRTLTWDRRRRRKREPRESE